MFAKLSSSLFGATAAAELEDPLDKGDTLTDSTNEPAESSDCDSAPTTSDAPTEGAEDEERASTTEASIGAANTDEATQAAEVDNATTEPRDPCEAPRCMPEPAPEPTDKRRLPPSQLPDAQASRRAAKRYRRDDTGAWVKGKAAPDGTWIPEIGARSFDNLDSALEHERTKTALRRQSWTNLKKSVAATRGTVAAEGLETRRVVVQQADATRLDIAGAREDIATARHAICEQINKGLEGVDKLLEETQHRKRAHGSPSQLSFFSRLLTHFRATELRELLARHGIEPSGTKHNLARLAAESLSEEDVDSFTAPRPGKPQRVNSEDRSGREHWIRFSRSHTPEDSSRGPGLINSGPGLAVDQGRNFD